MNAIDWLRSELAKEQERLNHNQPHSCKHCHYYDCNKTNNCRCSCGYVAEIITGRVVGLTMVIDQLENGVPADELQEVQEDQGQCSVGDV